MLYLSISISISLCHFFCVCNAFASIYINILSVSSASLVYILDNVTSRLVGDIFSCFFLKVSRAANGQFTYAYQESLRKVCVSQRVCHRRPYVLQQMYRIHDPKFHSSIKNISDPRFHAFETFLVETPTSFCHQRTIFAHTVIVRRCLKIRWIAILYRGIQYIFIARISLREITSRVSLTDQIKQYQTSLRIDFTRDARCIFFRTKRIAPHKIHRISNILSPSYRIVSIFRTISRKRSHLKVHTSKIP